MAYLKPPVITRRSTDPLAMRLNAHGGATLTVVGRQPVSRGACQSSRSKWAVAVIWCRRTASPNGLAISDRR